MYYFFTKLQLLLQLLLNKAEVFPCITAVVIVDQFLFWARNPFQGQKTWQPNICKLLEPG